MAKSKLKGLTVEDLETSFRNEKFSSLYLLYGEEDFLSDQVVDLLVEKALDESTKSFNLDVVSGGDVDARDIVSLVSAFPMIAERRVVVVRDFDRMPNKDLLLPVIDNPVSSTILILLASRPDFRTKIYKALEEHGTVAEFKRLYDNEVPRWISKRIEKLGKKAIPEASELIQAHVGRSLREIQNEIDKLFIYVGEKEIIDIDDVNNVVGISKQYNIFELQRSIGERDLARTMEIAEHMLDAGESPLGMIVMLTRYFQKLWLLQELRIDHPNDGKLSALLGVNPFFVREYLEAARRYPSDHLERCFEALVTADESLKSTGAGPKFVLTLMFFQILRPQQQLQPT
ncbi:MAG: DNA polymerase III subunit delta [Ignavibacteria bacterium]|nr:DNA polymerase III subunit delta [Ignavibacteria bacterium]